ncbi:family 31 glucosidase KIAA1161-like protein [Platysternon megacephalum]|uniref:Family 31 glucosidase KIAA1161-like protein n=1 Tax=Platysternon megacephalum TaxID=55544 RepID=A0A4D9E422_9SAUR|nr:family 31 glucosidase KIAA1161-like protein [Platysternon megacephalum]
MPLLPQCHLPTPPRSHGRGLGAGLRSEPEAGAGAVVGAEGRTAAGARGVAAAGVKSHLGDMTNLGARSWGQSGAGWNFPPPSPAGPGPAAPPNVPARRPAWGVRHRLGGLGSIEMSGREEPKYL